MVAPYCIRFGLHVTLSNKNCFTDVQITITARIQALRDAFIQQNYK